MGDGIERKEDWTNPFGFGRSALTLRSHSGYNGMVLLCSVSFLTHQIRMKELV